MDQAFVSLSNRKFCHDLFTKAVHLPSHVTTAQVHALISESMLEMQSNTSEYADYSLRDLNNILLNKVKARIFETVDAANRGRSHTLVLLACDRMWDDMTNNMFHFSVRCIPSITDVVGQLTVKGAWIRGGSRFARKLPYVSMVIDGWTPVNLHTSAPDENSALGTPMVLQSTTDEWWRPIDGLGTLTGIAGQVHSLTVTFTKPNNTLLDAVPSHVAVDSISSSPELLQSGLVRVCLVDTTHVSKGDVMRFVPLPGQPREQFLHRDQGHAVVDLDGDNIMIHAPHCMQDDGKWVPDLAQLKSIMDAHWGVAMNLSLQPCVVLEVVPSS